MKEKLYTILNRILDVPVDEINDQTSPENTATWDSFNSILMVSELEKAAGQSFTMAEVMAVKNVGDIKKLLYKYHVSYEC